MFIIGILYNSSYINGYVKRTYLSSFSVLTDDAAGIAFVVFLRPTYIIENCYKLLCPYQLTIERCD